MFFFYVAADGGKETNNSHVPFSFSFPYYLCQLLFRHASRLPTTSYASEVQKMPRYNLSKEQRHFTD